MYVPISCYLDLQIANQEDVCLCNQFCMYTKCFVGGFLGFFLENLQKISKNIFSGTQ